MRIAVTNSKYDDMGRLLRGLGQGFRFKSLPIEDLLDPKWTSQFDILFLTCDAWSSEWGGSDLQGHQASGSHVRLVWA